MQRNGSGVAAQTFEGEGPWEVRWAWNTGHSGVDHFPKPERALIFCEEMFRRISPPEYDVVKLSVVNVATGERLSAVTGKTYVPKERQPLAPGMRYCATCEGTGEILIIKTGNTIDCSRCDATGQEPSRRSD